MIIKRKFDIHASLTKQKFREKRIGHSFFHDGLRIAIFKNLLVKLEEV